MATGGGRRPPEGWPILELGKRLEVVGDELRVMNMTPPIRKQRADIHKSAPPQTVIPVLLP